MDIKARLPEIDGFLRCKTPAAWVDHAVRNVPELLVDHAHCEKKAASTALSLMFRYVEHEPLLHTLSRLAREELRHFEQVLKLLARRGVPYRHMQPARYAGSLRAMVRAREPERLVDLLVVGAVIEARSCERFASLRGRLDAELDEFYASLHAAESRHFHVYLGLGYEIGGDISARVEEFLAAEAVLIESPDTEFQFHSGIPAA